MTRYHSLQCTQGGVDDRELRELIKKRFKGLLESAKAKRSAPAQAELADARRGTGCHGSRAGHLCGPNTGKPVQASDCLDMKNMFSYHDANSASCNCQSIVAHAWQLLSLGTSHVRCHRSSLSSAMAHLDHWITDVQKLYIMQVCRPQGLCDSQICKPGTS